MFVNHHDKEIIAMAVTLSLLVNNNYKKLLLVEAMKYIISVKAEHSIRLLDNNWKQTKT